MTLTLYHLKTCDTCRKAIKALTEVGHTLNKVDVRADGVSPDILQKMSEALGWQTLLNTRSTTWRGLDPAQKADMDEAKALHLLRQHPTLIKRPVIIQGDKMTVGWTPAVQSQYI